MRGAGLRRGVAAGALIALIAAVSASGHAGPGPAIPGFTSTVKGLRPGIPRITVRVLGGEDRLWLLNRTSRAVTVYGYEGEPYLRFSPQGVYENQHSPASYLNDDRFARIVVPPEANAGVKPLWKRMAKSRAWAWHDHRIHWMSTFPPKPVVNDRASPHHIFDWKVPAALDAKPFAILGSLDYAPPPGGP